MQPIPEMIFNIKIGEEEFNRNITDDLTVDIDSLDDCLAKQPALYAYYATRLQQATELRDQAEFELEKTVNEMMGVVRDEFTNATPKPTAVQIQAVVNTRPEVLARKQIFLKKAANRDKLFSLVRSLEHKKDMILSLAYRKRSELESMAQSVVYKKRSQIPISGIEEDLSEEN